MRIPRLWVILGLLLAACGPTASEELAATQMAATEFSRLATEVAEDANATSTPLPPTLTPVPTPVELTLQEAMLTTEQLNSLVPRWIEPPAIDNTALEEALLCIHDCVSARWASTDGASTLTIQIVALDNRDEAFIYFHNVKEVETQPGNVELPLLEAIRLPADTFIWDGTALGLGYQIYLRQAQAVTIIRVFMPDQTLEQHVLFLSLWAEQQVNQLAAGGF
jgi:hypothetical protein